MFLFPITLHVRRDCIMTSSPFTDATLCDASAFVTACAAAAVMIIKAAQMSGCTHVRMCGGALSCGNAPRVSKKDDNYSSSGSTTPPSSPPVVCSHVYYDDSDASTDSCAYDRHRHLTEPERRV